MPQLGLPEEVLTRWGAVLVLVFVFVLVMFVFLLLFPNQAWLERVLTQR